MSITDSISNPWAVTDFEPGWFQFLYAPIRAENNTPASKELNYGRIYIADMPEEFKCRHALTYGGCTTHAQICYIVQKSSDPTKRLEDLPTPTLPEEWKLVQTPREKSPGGPGTRMYFVPKGSLDAIEAQRLARERMETGGQL